MGKLEALENAIRKELKGKTIGKITVENIHSPIINPSTSHLPENEDIFSMEKWTRVTIANVLVEGSIKTKDGGTNYNTQTIGNVTFNISYDNETETFSAKLAL